MPRTRSKRSFLGNPKEIAMILLAATSVMLPVIEVFSITSIHQYPVLGKLDTLISLAFLADFFLHYRLSSHQKSFFSKHWYELIAAIPLPIAVSLPLLTITIGPVSVLHLFRLFRLIIRIKILLEVSLEYTRHSYPVYVFTLMSFVIFSGGGAFYYFEHLKNPNVTSYWDAVWWAIVTSTTIGYGDIYPTTPGGRIVAIIVMFIGIAALGAFIASLNSIIIGRKFNKKH